MKNTSPKKVTANHHASIADESGATDCSSCLLSLKRSLHIFQLQYNGQVSCKYHWLLVPSQIKWFPIDYFDNKLWKGVMKTIAIWYDLQLFMACEKSKR